MLEIFGITRGMNAARGSAAGVAFAVRSRCTMAQPKDGIQRTVNKCEKCFVWIVKSLLFSFLVY